MPKLIAQNLTGDQFTRMKDPDAKDDSPNLKLTNASDLSDFKAVDIDKHQHQVRGFYEKQNALILLFKQHIGDVNSTSNDIEISQPLEEDAEAEEGWLIQSAIILSFLSNVLLLVLKLWMAIATGSMAIIASAADSLLDLVSGIVLLVADRMANQNVDFYKYPEGRSRVEPIGIIIFATVMCLSSLNILIECIKRIITGLVGSPLEIEVGVLGFVVLGLTIVIKFALWLWCKFVLGMVGGSASVDAYAQDHMNDVLTNATAVGCVILATQLKGWWIADPLGAAVISLWIIYSWWETGKEHVAHLSGHVAPINFHQRLTFIAANCDDLILKVDTVRAFHFGEKFIVEIHVVLDEQLPLRVAHDVGEKLEVMVEKLEEVDRCFVHMDYEYEHSPEYKRRQPAPTINVNNSPLLSRSSSRSTSGGSTPSTPNGEPSSPR